MNDIQISHDRDVNPMAPGGHFQGQLREVASSLEMDALNRSCCVHFSV